MVVHDEEVGKGSTFQIELPLKTFITKQPSNEREGALVFRCNCKCMWYFTNADG